MAESIVEGQTAPLEWILKANGVPQNLVDMTVTAVLKSAAGKVVSTTDDVVVFGSSSGLVRLNPDAVDFRSYRSPYTLRFRVEDVDGKAAFFPSGEPVIIIVWKA
jgi:hypothetical protein